MITKQLYKLDDTVLVRALLPLSVRDLSDVLARTYEDRTIAYWGRAVDPIEKIDGCPVSVTIEEEEDLHLITLNVDHIRRAIEGIVTGSFETNREIRNWISDAVSDQCLGCLDAEATDAIIQIACFTYLKYA